MIFFVLLCSATRFSKPGQTLREFYDFIASERNSDVIK